MPSTFKLGSNADETKNIKLEADGTGQLVIKNGAGTVFGSISSSGMNLINIQTFTASGSYTPTAGTKKIIVEVVGGGGGGGAGNADNQFGSGGGGGGYAAGILDIDNLTVPVSVTIGAGGTGGPSGGGSAGGTSIFDTLSASGGDAGLSASSSNTYTAFGSGSGGFINLDGGSGDYGGDSALRGRGKGGSPAKYGSIQPNGILGGGGIPGRNYGTGGNGGGRTTTTTRGGGDGSSGIVVIWEYA